MRVRLARPLESAEAFTATSNDRSIGNYSCFGRFL